MSVAHPTSVGVPATDDTDPFHTLRERLEGQLLTADHAAYDDARRTVSLRSDRRPSAIVRALSPDDVVVAVRFAREQGLPLAVRSGGHSIALQSGGAAARASSTTPWSSTCR